MKKLFSLNILNLPVDRPKTVLILVMLLVLFCGAGLTRLKFSDDIRVFFDKDNIQLKEYEKIEDTYSKSNSVLFVIAPNDGDIFTTKTLSAIEEITRLSWTIPYSRRVDSLTNFQNTHGNNDELVVENLVKNANELSAKKLAEAKQVAINEPLLVNRLISPKGHVSGINVTIDLPGKNPLTEQPEVVAAARKIAADIMQANPDIKVHLTGLVMINNSLAEEGKSDMATLMPIMILIILVTMGLMLRNIAGVCVAFIMIIFSIIIAMGVAGWCGILLSPPVLSAVNIIMTVAVADAVHIMVGFLGEMREGKDKKTALKKTLFDDFSPITITNITSAIGFLCLNTSESPPFRDLGNIVAAGVLAAYIMTFTLKPALLTLLPVKVKVGHGHSESKFMGKLADAITASYKPILIVIVIIASFLTYSISKNEINDEFVKYFHAKLPFRVATDFTINNMTGFEFIEYSLDSGVSEGINNPEFLKKVDEFAEWYRKQDKVRHVYNFAEIMKRLNKNMHNEDSEYYKIPDNRETAAQYLLLYELSLSFGRDLTDQVSIDKSAVKMRISLDNITTNEMLALEEKADEWIRQNAKGIFTGKGSGQSLMFAHIGQNNVSSVLEGSVMAMLLISLLLVFAFRSLKFGTISLLPNLIPAGMAFGIWGLVVGQIGLGTSVVMDMTLGIVIDDTVHFLSSYLRFTRKEGLSARDAIRRTFETIGLAVVFTSVILVAGFSVLALSNFALNSDMAKLSAITITIALFTDMFLLPAILILLEGKKHDKKLLNN